MDKEKILKDSVRKLLNLNISDQEILGNLKSVGVSAEQAKRILRETKEEQSREKSEEKLSIPSKEELVKPLESEEDSSDIYRKVYEDLEGDEMKTPVVSKPIKNPGYSPPLAGSEDIAKLWEKGIMATINAKFGEMERIQKEIDKVIDKKVKDKVEVETRKIETILSSQRDLFNNKIDTHLQAKADEIKNVIESRANQLEDLHGKVQNEVVKVQSEKKFNAELLNSINEKIEGLESIKSQMISDTNRAIMQNESKFSEFMYESKQKRDETEARINRTLQLESKITEGLLEDAKQKIDTLKLEKTEELTEKIEAELAEFEEMARKVDPQGITDRLLELKELENQLIKRQKSLDEELEEGLDRYDKKIEHGNAEAAKRFSLFRKEVARIETANLQELKKEYAANVDELFAKHLISWDRKLKLKEKEIDDIMAKVDLEKFNATMDSLELFKQQFLNTVNKSIQDYNKSKRQLAESILERDKAINYYLQRIDSKMKQLNAFEKRFAAEVSGLIDKIPEGKPSKKPVKKKKIGTSTKNNIHWKG